MPYRVLIVEDESRMLEVLEDFFKSKGFEVFEAENGVKALDIAEEQIFDVVLLDIMMPGIDGFSVCRQLRKYSSIPIIFITARVEEEDKLYGYGLGADDYITKPFSLAVLYAKVINLIKRDKGLVLGSEAFSICGIEIDLRVRTVKVDGENIQLAPKEYDLLIYLIENRDRILSREQLLYKIWGYDFEGYERVVDSHIKKLRSALGSKANHIRTIIKAGYKFEEAGDDEKV